VNKLVKEKESRNIGMNVTGPEKKCNDINCPFHGKLSVRGQTITGIVKSHKMKGSISVTKEFMHYVKKYERFEKRTSSYLAHCPSCMELKEGDKVRIAECRPLSKTVSFVAIEKL